MAVDESRTFFCSELVAKAFKVAGVLEDDDTACSCSQRGRRSLKKTLECIEELRMFLPLRSDNLM